MLNEELSELKNQIKEIHDMCHELNISLYELKDSLQTINDYFLPKLDFDSIDLKGALSEFKK